MDKLVLPDSMTIGQAYDPAMSIRTVEEAGTYLTALIERSMRLNPEHSFEEAKAIELGNIGYYAGYGSSEDRQRVNLLFGAVHPIFGGNFAVTVKEALEAGKKRANK